MSNTNNNTTNYTLRDIAHITDVNPFETVGSTKPGSIAGRKIWAINIGIAAGIVATAISVGTVILGCMVTAGSTSPISVLLPFGGSITTVVSLAITFSLLYNGFRKKLTKDEVTNLIGDEGKMALAETNDLIDRFAIYCLVESERLVNQANQTDQPVLRACCMAEAESWNRKAELTEKKKVSYAHIISALVTELRSPEPPLAAAGQPAPPQFTFTAPPPPASEEQTI